MGAQNYFSRRALLVVLVLLMSTCSTIRMRYSATVGSENGGQPVGFEKSYPVGGAFKPLCWIAGILYGGSCWFYLVMPTVDQKDEVILEAREELHKKLGRNDFHDERVERVSWSRGETVIVAPGSKQR